MAIKKIVKRCFSVFKPSDRLAVLHSQKPGGRKICYFAHYDQKGNVAEYVFYYLKSINAAAFEIVFVSTAPFINGPHLERLKTHCIIVALRKNVGLDFCSWKTGMSLHKNNSTLETILLTNDSLYGPFMDLRAIERKMTSFEFDLWGMSESFERERHLQSYFLYLNKKVIASPTFKRFWRKVKPLSQKAKMIKRYEIGFSKAMAQNGFIFGAYCPYKLLIDSIEKHSAINQVDYSHDMSDYKTNPRNPTLFYWRQMIELCDFPFLKTYLLRFNPFGQKNLDSVKTVVARKGYEYSFIEEHLRNLG